jgi:hypothetical protein
VLRASGEESEVLLPFGVLDQLTRSAGRRGPACCRVKTIEHHLRNAFHELGISRRRELAHRLAQPAVPT